MHEEFGYPVCAGWFEEFAILGTDWLYGVKMNYVQSEDFVMEPMCNYHENSSCYLSRKYWIVMVEMFGFSIEKDIVLTDPNKVKPEKTSHSLNTRSHDGSFCDAWIIEEIANSKQLLIS